MRRLWSIPARSVPCVLALAASLFGCAGDVGDINRVQPGYVKKSDLLNSSWYYRRTVVDASETVPPYTAMGSGDLFTIERVRWDVQEEYLFAYRDYEYVPGSEVKDETDDYYGSPIAAFAVLSHFDIAREYNPDTGEKTNVTSENTTDRPWNEREYVRVNWSQPGLSMVSSFDYFILPVDFLDMAPGDGGLNYVHEDDAQNPFHARLTPEHGYLDFVVDYMAASDPYTCKSMYDMYTCGAGQLRVRHAFWRVDKDREARYKPLWYPDSVVVKDDQGREIMDPDTGEVKREPIFERFGYYRLDRLTYDDYRGLTESGRLYRMLRFDIWDKSVDDTGKDIPYEQRQARPIYYYLNADFPAELIPAATDVAKQWNEVFKNTVAALQKKAVTSVPDMFVLNINSCNKDNLVGYLNAHKEVRKSTVATMGEELRDDNITAHLMNWCSAAEYHSTGEEDPFTWQQIGDPRYNMLYWIGKRIQAEWSGYGPMLGDPISGRIVTATAFILGEQIEIAVTRALELVNYINGEIDLDDILAGSYLPYRSELFSPDKVAQEIETVDQALVKAAANKPSDAFMQSLGERMRALGSSTSELLTPMENGSHFDERLARVAGTTLETEYLLRPEDLAVAGRGEWTPGQAVSDTLAQAASVAERRKQRERVEERERFFRERLFDRFDDIIEPEMLGLARQLRDLKPEERRNILRAAVFKATALHELGHNVGLRHNFEGSYDALNYPKRFWEVQKASEDAYPDNPDAALQRRREERQPEFMYSSIMDYFGKLNADFGGLAPYDNAAVKFGYGQIIEKFTDGSVESGKTLRRWRHLHDYTKLPAHLGGIDNMYRRTDVVFDWTKPNITEQEVQNLTANEVPYLFCSDEYNYKTPTCRTFDFGANLTQIAAADRIRYIDYAVFYSFLRNRLVMDVDRAINRGARIFRNAVTTYQYYYYWWATDAEFRDLANTDLAQDMVASFTDTFNLMSELIGAPEPGFYSRCKTTVSVSGTPTEQTVYYPQGFVGWNPLTEKYEGPYDGEDCSKPDEYHPELVIPVSGVAQPFFLGFSEDYTSWTFSYVGNYWDRQNALEELADSYAVFLRSNRQEDRRVYSVSPYRLFNREIAKLFGDVILNQPLSYAPSFAENAIDPQTKVLTVTSNEMLRMFDVGRALEKAYPYPPPGTAKALEPGRAFLYPPVAAQTPRMALLYGQALLTSPLDATLDFGRYLRVAVEGAQDDLAVQTTADIMVATCTLPESGITYKAWTTDDGFSITHPIVTECAKYAGDYAAARSRLCKDPANGSCVVDDLERAQADYFADQGNAVKKQAYAAALLVVRGFERQMSYAQSQLQQRQQTLQYARRLNLVYQFGVEP